LDLRLQRKLGLLWLWRMKWLVWLLWLFLLRLVGLLGWVLASLLRLVGLLDGVLAGREVRFPWRSATVPKALALLW
jgi:hypothetical protein